MNGNWIGVSVLRAGRWVSPLNATLDSAAKKRQVYNSEDGCLN